MAKRVSKFKCLQCMSLDVVEKDGKYNCPKCGTLTSYYVKKIKE